MATVSKHGRILNIDVTWKNDGHGDAPISGVQCVFGQVERGHSSDSQARQGMGASLKKSVSNAQDPKY